MKYSELKIAVFWDIMTNIFVNICQSFGEIPCLPSSWQRNILILIV
jgi:hypothetical protein